MSLMLKPSGEIVEEHILYRMDPDKLNIIAASVFIASDVMALTGAILGWTFLLFIALAVFAASMCLGFVSWRAKRGQTKFSGRYVVLDEYEDYVRLFEQYNSSSTPTSGLKHVRNAWLGGLQLCATYMSDLSSLQREEARFSESFEDARRTVAKTYAELFSDFKHYETVFNLTRGQNLSKNAALLQATDVMIKEVIACGELTSQASRLFVESRMPDTHTDILNRELTAVQQRLDALSEIHPKTPMIEAGPAPVTKSVHPKIKKIAPEVPKVTADLIEEVLEDLDGAAVPNPKHVAAVLENAATDSIRFHPSSSGTPEFCWNCKECIKALRTRKECTSSHSCEDCERVAEHKDSVCMVCDMRHEDPHFVAAISDGSMTAHAEVIRSPVSLYFQQNPIR